MDHGDVETVWMGTAAIIMTATTMDNGPGFVTLVQHIPMV
jgi:hypothetical protein